MVAKKSNRQQLLWHTCVIDEFLMFNATSFHKIFQEGLLLFPLVAEAGYWTSKPSTWQKQSLKSCTGYYLMMIIVKILSYCKSSTYCRWDLPTCCASLHLAIHPVCSAQLLAGTPRMIQNKSSVKQPPPSTSYHTPLKINFLIITTPPPQKK